MTEACQIQALPFCPRPHPFGVAYRLQGLNDDDHPSGPERHSPARWCPWCDFERLRHSGVGDEPRSGFLGQRSAKPLDEPEK